MIRNDLMGGVKNKVIDKSKSLKRFNNYVSFYDPEDPKIKLKIEHTFHVSELSAKIACAVGADPELAWLIGVLHDIGRFEQIRRYNTFSDALSVDHAALGADILFRSGLIAEFSSDLTNDQRCAIEMAVRNHSALTLPKGLTQEEKLYCNIIRDADKLDGFRVNCETPLEEIYNVSTEELRTSAVSSDVKECFNRKKAVPRQLRSTPMDNLVSILCWTFELVYPVSKKLAKEQGYVNQLLEYQSDNPDTIAWFAYMRDKIWK